MSIEYDYDSDYGLETRELEVEFEIDSWEIGSNYTFTSTINEVVEKAVEEINVYNPDFRIVDRIELQSGCIIWTIAITVEVTLIDGYYYA